MLGNFLEGRSRAQTRTSYMARGKEASLPGPWVPASVGRWLRLLPTGSVGPPPIRTSLLTALPASSPSLN